MPDLPQRLLLIPIVVLLAIVAVFWAWGGAARGAPTAAVSTVTSTADGGAGSLRQLITDAASGDTIAIPAGTRETGWAIFSTEKSIRPNKIIMPGEVPSPPSPLHLGQSDQPHAQWKVVETGSILAHHRPQRVDVTARIKAIEAELDKMAARWQPKEVACGKPSLMQLPSQREGYEMLTRSLERWAQGHGLPIYSYPLRQIRAAILGRANSGREELAYAVMTRWGLLGEGKSTHEWNAIAVGDYHLSRQESAAGIEI